MKKPKIILIAAVAKNGVIGNRNSLPWYIPEDLRRFKKLTDGKTVLMGRKTFDSIINRIGKPLPNRKNIVVTSKHDHGLPDDVTVIHHLHHALHHSNEPEIYVIGGGEVYKQAFDSAHKLHLTHIHDEVEGDVTFPNIDFSQWKKTFEEPYEKFTFADYERI
ncbi:MAG TPA: dihydrofolate reductase [Verrucomicrobiae bacterium]|nr:dihydrofolate reductase [Verrucomicrobiae bacterium]